MSWFVVCEPRGCGNTGVMLRLRSHLYVYYYTVVTPLRKAASYEPRIAILGIWGDTWQIRHLRVVVTRPLRGLRDAFWKFCHVKSALSTVVSPT